MWIKDLTIKLTLPDGKILLKVCKDEKELEAEWNDAIKIIESNGGKFYVKKFGSGYDKKAV